MNCDVGEAKEGLGTEALLPMRNHEFYRVNFMATYGGSGNSGFDKHFYNTEHREIFNILVS